MYLSTLFLSEIEKGADSAIRKCNEAFLTRFGAFQQPSSAADALKESFQSSQCDEIMALWDVCREFLEELPLDLPIIRAMNTIRTARGQAKVLRNP